MADSDSEEEFNDEDYNKEAFLHNYDKMSDEELKAKHDHFFTPFNKPTTITYGIAVQNMSFELKIMAAIIKIYIENSMCTCYITNPEIKSGIIAINSNEYNFAKIGYESYIKLPKVAKSRKLQGNGSSFGSCIEFSIILNDMEGKIYKPKCFPQDGKIHLTGVKNVDLSDGREVIQYIITLFDNISKNAQVIEYCITNNITFGTNFTFTDEKIILINYKLRLIRTCPRILINIKQLQKVFEHYKNLPAPIDSIKSDNLTKFTCKLKFDTCTVSIRILISGKIAITASKSEKISKVVYKTLYIIFNEYWNDIIAIRPRNDADEEKYQLYLKNKV